VGVATGWAASIGVSAISVVGALTGWALHATISGSNIEKIINRDILSSLE